jgi:tetratricopeptide (TPR) repeat protein
MSGAKTLTRAERLLRQRRYSEAISLLESQVFHFRENASFYRILGTACLRTGEFAGAHTYLTRAVQLRHGDSSTELALALVHLRRRETAAALTLILNVIDREPRNRKARRLLSLVRTTEEPSEFVELTETRLIRRYLPSHGVYVPRWIPILIGALAIAALGIVYLPRVVDTVLESRGEFRVGLEPLELDLPANLSASEGEFRYQLTDQEIARLTDTIGELFNRFRDNLARREANRLLLSNASPIIKERVRLVASYFRVPTFVDFQDNFSYREVASEPWLYEGCHVRWNGRTSNIERTDDGVSFTLLVGYTDEQTLEGTVDVEVPFLAEVEPGSIELIGRVERDGSDFRLVATGIRPIVRRNE